MDGIDLVEEQSTNYRPKYKFLENSHDQVDKIIDLVSFIKMCPQCKFKIHIMSRNL